MSKTKFEVHMKHFTCVCRISRNFAIYFLEFSCEIVFGTISGNYSRHDEGAGVAQDGGHTPANRLTETCSVGLQRPPLKLDIPVVVK